MRSALLLSMLFLWAPLASAIEVQDIQAVDDGTSYRVTLRAVLDARAAAILAVLEDYPGYPRLDARILKSRVLGRNGTEVLLYTRIRGCIGSVFCHTMDRVEQVRESDHGLEASVIPSRSDVQYGLTTVELIEQGRQTLVRYQMQMEPKFWLPRWLVGPLILRTLREGTLSMFDNVERATRTST